MTNETTGEAPTMQVEELGPEVDVDASTAFDVVPEASAPGVPAAMAVEGDAAPAGKKISTGLLPAPGPAREVPAWFPASKIPKGLVFPKGYEAVFLRIPAGFTVAAHKGDRYLIAWSTSESDEKLAMGRSMGDRNRISSELTKQGIRAIDGEIADWSGVPCAGSVDALWRELGAKGRNLLLTLFLKINTLDEKELTSFFESCIAVVPTV